MRPERRYPRTVNVYVELTREFNEGALRAVLSSGQAVVLHRLAIMGKDGAWILRESPDALRHVLGVLERHGARYRFGAPLDTRWAAGGWSSHFEFRREGLRIRTDFVTRPPRIAPEDLARMWVEQEGRDLPFVDVRRLTELKKTNREKDYAVIGELARRLEDPREELLASRSARDIERLAGEHPSLVRELVRDRPVLGRVGEGRDALERALDEERRALIHANERRLESYRRATMGWAAFWSSVQTAIEGLPLAEAHRIVVARADGVLPTGPEPEDA